MKASAYFKNADSNALSMAAMSCKNDLIQLDRSKRYLLTVIIIFF